jgi:hypothetical protein
VDLGLDRVAIEEDDLLSAGVRLVDPRPQLGDAVRLVGDGQDAGGLEIAVDPVGPGEGQQLLEVRPAELRSSWSISPGKWRSPLARPWTRLASQKPPLRPLAPNPTKAASTTTMRRVGSVSASRIAVHRPVNPAPTIATSVRSAPRNGGRGSGRWPSSQKLIVMMADRATARGGPVGLESIPSVLVRIGRRTSDIRTTSGPKRRISN